ncbi:hypothetical protein ACHAPG_002026 [Botrytis cinerea]
MSTGNTANSIVAFWARGLCMRITSRHQCQYKGDGETNPHHDQSWYEDLKGKIEVGRGTGPAFAEDGEISLRCGTVHAAAHTEMLSDVSVGYNWV